MKKNREDISREINEKVEQIKTLQLQILELTRESMSLSDDKQWFTEAEEEIAVSKRPKKIEKMLIGRINWMENFRDESTGKLISIERSQKVKVNGEWL